MWRYELHPPHLICTATLPRENQNTENVILQCMYETKIHDIEDLWKRLIQTWFESDQDIIDTAKDQ